MHRLDKRKYDQLREVSIIPDYNKHAEGSALIKFGDTHVICNASVEKAVPRWMQDKIKDTYINLNSDITYCDFVYNWKKE